MKTGSVCIKSWVDTNTQSSVQAQSQPAVHCPLAALSIIVSHPLLQVCLCPALTPSRSMHLCLGSLLDQCQEAITLPLSSGNMSKPSAHRTVCPEGAESMPTIVIGHASAIASAWSPNSLNALNAHQNQHPGTALTAMHVRSFMFSA